MLVQVCIHSDFAWCFLVWIVFLFVQFSVRQLVLGPHTGSESIQYLAWCFSVWTVCLFACLLVQISMLQLVLVFVPTGSECFLVWTACLFVCLVFDATTCSGHSYRVCIHSDFAWCFLVWTVCLFVCSVSGTTACSGHSYRVCIQSDFA